MMGISCFRAISGMGWVGWVGWVGWDLCAGLFYEHRFAMLIREGFKKREMCGLLPYPGEGWSARVVKKPFSMILLFLEKSIFSVNLWNHFRTPKTCFTLGRDL